MDAIAAILRLDRAQRQLETALPGSREAALARQEVATVMAALQTYTPPAAMEMPYDDIAELQRLYNHVSSASDSLDAIRKRLEVHEAPAALNALTTLLRIERDLVARRVAVRDAIEQSQSMPDLSDEDDPDALREEIDRLTADSLQYEDDLQRTLRNQQRIKALQERLSAPTSTSSAPLVVEAERAVKRLRRLGFDAREAEFELEQLRAATEETNYDRPPFEPVRGPALNVPLPPWVGAATREAVYRDLFYGRDGARLQPDVYRLVFGDRQRVHHQATGDAANRFETFDDNDELDWSRRRVGFTHGNGTSGIEWRDAPPVARLLSRYQAIQTDGNLCSMHSANNVACALLFNPPLMYASRAALTQQPTQTGVVLSSEELALAGLRRGVVYAMLSFKSVYDTAVLRSDRVNPDPKMLENLIRASGGAVVLEVQGGHFVSLVWLPLLRQWTLFTTRGEVEGIRRGESLGALLEAFYRRQSGVSEALAAAASPQLAAQLANVRSVDARAALGYTELRIMVALPRVKTLTRDSSGVDMLAFYWWRYVVTHTSHVARGAQSPGDLNSPLPSPLGVSFAADQMLYFGLLCGPELVRNPFTAYLARFELETTLNELSERLAAYLSGADADFNLRQFLAETNGALITPQSIGLLLGVRECSPLTNREWLRVVAIHFTIARMRAERMPTDRQHLLLLSFVMFSDHRRAGDTAERYPQIANLWKTTLYRDTVTRRARLRGDILPALPRGTFPRLDAAIVGRETIDSKEQYIALQLWLLTRSSHERSLWLLYETGRFTVEQLRALDTPLPDVPNDRFEQAIPLLDTLRERFMGVPDFSKRLNRQVQFAMMRAENSDRLSAQQPMLGQLVDAIALPPVAGATVDGENLALLNYVYTRDGPNDELRATIYDPQNERVDPSTVRDMTARYRSADGLISDSALSVVTLEELAYRQRR